MPADALSIPRGTRTASAPMGLLPGGGSGFTLTFGAYADPAFVGMKGVLRLSAPLVHLATGGVVQQSWTVTIAADGTGSLSGLPFNDDPAFTPIGTTYSLQWQALSYKPTPGDRTFTVNRSAGATVDYDLIAPTSTTTAPAPAGLDALVAALLADPTSQTGAAVEHAVAGVAPADTLKGLAGHRLVGLGDSITAADSYLRYLAALSGGKVRFAHNAGVGGDQISQMLARFDTDVTPYAPTMVSLMGGTNDYTFGATDAQFRDRVRSFVAKVHSIGAIPLLFTSPPCSVLSDPDRAKIPRNNAWMAEYAARNGIALIDAYAALADPAQSYGMYQTGLVNGDGIHPNAAGHWAMAQAAWAVLSPLLPPRPVLASTVADPTNLVVNGLLKDGNGDGWADNWGQNWGTDAGTWTYSIVNDAQVPGGTMQRVNFTAASGRIQRNQAVATGFAPGDTLRLTALATTTATTAAGINVACNGASGNLANPFQTLDQPMTRGVIDLTFVVPAGTTTLDVTLDGYAVGSNVTSTVDFGAVTLRNETALGLLAP